MQDSERFLGAAAKALQELNGKARKVLIVNKTPVWNSESKQQLEEAALGKSELSGSQHLEIQARCLPELYGCLKTHCVGLNTRWGLKI